MSHDGGLDNQVMFRERRACSTVRRGDAMCFEPKRPVLTVEVMEKRKCQAIGRAPEGATLFQQIGARDDDKFGGNEPGGFRPGYFPNPCRIANSIGSRFRSTWRLPVSTAISIFG